MTLGERPVLTYSLSNLTPDVIETSCHICCVYRQLQCLFPKKNKKIVLSNNKKGATLGIVGEGEDNRKIAFLAVFFNVLLQYSGSMNAKAVILF
jgi:hypothetical protein